MEFCQMEESACPCKRIECERHGNCAECQAHHHAKEGKKGLTRCKKLAAREEKRMRKGRRGE